MKLLFRVWNDNGNQRELYIAPFSTFARAQHYAEVMKMDNFKIKSVDQIDIDPVIPPSYLKYIG